MTASTNAKAALATKGFISLRASRADATPHVTSSVLLTQRHSADLLRDDVTCSSYTLSGLAVTTFLYAVLALQAWTYAKRYPADRRLLKLLVVAVVIFASFGFGIFFYIAWATLVQEHSVEDPVVIRVGDAATIMTVQSFYVMRTFKLSRGLSNVAAAITAALSHFRLHTWAHSRGRPHYSYRIVLSFILVEARNTKVAQIDQPVGGQRAIDHLAERLPSAWQIAVMIIILSVPTRFASRIISSVAPNIYCTSMLYSLNSRNSLSSIDTSYSNPEVYSTELGYPRIELRRFATSAREALEARKPSYDAFSRTNDEDEST
ncbi:hypothetical protein GY45DRAFT_1341450 [Cubamyces sp. BRFM 1775]|nr:hypothetical protein GY45DRAFT_1341450 [Cubamyces sp. BRFM 1775]